MLLHGQAPTSIIGSLQNKESASGSNPMRFIHFVYNALTRSKYKKNDEGIEIKNIKLYLRQWPLIKLFKSMIGSPLLRRF